ncbi:methyltransferase, partial [Alistipes sp. OttesenSCG-928-L06]|nr:methyltransferase [Alistipes sp. OttesenSCG-928-L06]
ISEEMLRLNCRILTYDTTIVSQADGGERYHVEAIIRIRRHRDEDALMRYMQSFPDVLIERIE